MRLSRRSEPFDSDQFIYELKIDGFRALAQIKEPPMLAVADGNVLCGFADLAEWIEKHLRVEGVVLDGRLRVLMMQAGDRRLCRGV